MKIEYDQVADAMYMRYTDFPVNNTRESAEWIVDYDCNGDVVGIEILGVQSIFSKNNITISKSELVTH